MFLQVSVILFTGVGYLVPGAPGPGGSGPGGCLVPGGGLVETGMHSRVKFLALDI